VKITATGDGGKLASVDESTLPVRNGPELSTQKGRRVFGTPPFCF
jgi:hypothetical protein